MDKTESYYRIIRIVLIISTCLLIGARIAGAQTTQTSFHGDLGDPGFNGILDMQFRLYDAAIDGTQIGTTVSIPAVSVSGGKFKVSLNYGAAAYNSDDRWVEIRTSPAGAGTYTVLDPREKILSAPYSIRSLVSTSADQLAGTDASEFVQTSDPRLSDARPPVAGSSSYIHNSSFTQTGAFNISGSGTAGGTLSGNVVNASTQYNLNGVRILHAPSDNFFAASSAGLMNTTGFGNTAVGSLSGRSNTTGGNNTTFGKSSGQSNVTGAENSMFGSSAGYLNTASFNSFFGSGAGRNTTTGERSSFFGRDSGYRNTTGARNAFYGNTSGYENTTGNDNTFLGHSTGYSNTTGSNNTAVGANANVAAGLSYATAIGSSAYASNSNSVVLGRWSDTVRVPGKLQVSTLGTAGSTALCRNGSAEIASCSSSIRYKSNVLPYQNGLELIKRLRPVSFSWRQDGTMDFGLVAEEVNKIEPLLSNYTDSGQVE